MATTNDKPLAPTMAQAIGFNDRRVDVGAHRDQVGTPVQRGHSKVAVDPSEGSANARVQTVEQGGARYRVHPQTSAVNQPYSAATQSMGRIVDDGGVAFPDKEYQGNEVGAFEDAPAIAGYAPGHHRIRGYTAKQG